MIVPRWFRREAIIPARSIKPYSLALSRGFVPRRSRCRTTDKLSDIQRYRLHPVLAYFAKVNPGQLFQNARKFCQGAEGPHAPTRMPIGIGARLAGPRAKLLRS
jgi:hypothetical protein